MKKLLIVLITLGTMTVFADIFGEDSKNVISVEKLPKGMIRFAVCERKEGNVLITNPEKFTTTLVNCQVLGKGDYSLEKIKKLRRNRILWSMGVGAFQGLIFLPMSIIEIGIYGIPLISGIPHLLLSATLINQYENQHVLRGAVLNDDKIILKNYNDDDMIGIAKRLNSLLSKI